MESTSISHLFESGVPPLILALLGREPVSRIALRSGMPIFSDLLDAEERNKQHELPRYRNTMDSTSTYG